MIYTVMANAELSGARCQKRKKKQALIRASA